MRQIMAMGGNVDVAGILIGEFFRRCGGVDGRIVILPCASNLAQGGQPVQERCLQLGIKISPEILPIHARALAYREEYIRAVHQASGIFFTGGDQAKLCSILCGTPLLEAIHEKAAEGTVIAGTSAGAAAMGKVMIAHGRSGSGARRDLAYFAEGLGLLENMIIDQHFHQRNRLGRLLFAVTVHPGSLGIGIDEDTAAVFEDQAFSVLGKNCVTVLQAAGEMTSNLADVNSGEYYAAGPLFINQLTQGSRYDLVHKAASIAQKPLE